MTRFVAGARDYHLHFIQHAVHLVVVAVTLGVKQPWQEADCLPLYLLCVYLYTGIV